MDVIYANGSATVARVREMMPNPPSYSAVRAMLRVLEEKGHVKHRTDGPRYVFFPVVDRRRARESALEHVVNTFFDGSIGQAVTALLDEGASELSEEELNRLSRTIDKARREGR